MFAKSVNLSASGRLIAWCVITYTIVTLVAMSLVFGVTHHHVHQRDYRMLKRILIDLSGEYAEYHGLTDEFKHCIIEDINEHNPSKMQIIVTSPEDLPLYATSPVKHPENPLRRKRIALPDGNHIEVVYDINDSVDFDWFLGILLAIIAVLGIVAVAVFSWILAGRILKLNQTVEEKERAIAELKMLTDDIAHDLRTPLTRLKMAAEATLIAEEASELAEKVAHDTESMVEMINTMLEISQTGFRIDRTPRETLDLVALIRRTAELYQAPAEDQNLSLVVDVPQRPVFLSAHQSKMQQVLGNLLDNALKFTPAGGRISLKLEVKDGRIVLMVQDTGLGIDENDLPHIFKRFYRADASRNLPGNGLGLALVEAIVTSYGGKITCRSTRGEGTTFTVCLPANAAILV